MIRYILCAILDALIVAILVYFIMFAITGCTVKQTHCIVNPIERVLSC